MKTLALAAAALVSAAVATPAAAGTFLSTTVQTEYWGKAGRTLQQTQLVRSEYGVFGSYNAVQTSRELGAKPSRIEMPVTVNPASTASAYVDLAQGKLGAYAKASGTGPAGYANTSVFSAASLEDDVTFTAAGAGVDTVTTFGFELALHGTFAGSGNWVADGGFGDPGQRTDFYYSGQTFASPDYQSINGDVTYTVLSADRAVIRGTASFTGASWRTHVTFGLRAIAEAQGDGSQSGLADLGNTATLRLTLPATVTVASASGQFLTAVPPVSAVPEPASWALMLSGFAMVGGASRYRRRRVAMGC